MRMPLRVHITWENDNTLKIETGRRSTDAAAPIHHDCRAARRAVPSRLFDGAVDSRRWRRTLRRRLRGFRRRRRQCQALGAAQGRDHATEPGLAAKKRRALQREHHARRRYFLRLSDEEDEWLTVSTHRRGSEVPARLADHELEFQAGAGWVQVEADALQGELTFARSGQFASLRPKGKGQTAKAGTEAITGPRRECQAIRPGHERFASGDGRKDSAHLVRCPTCRCGACRPRQPGTPATTLWPDGVAGFVCRAPSARRHLVSPRDMLSLLSSSNRPTHRSHPKSNVTPIHEVAPVAASCADTTLIAWLMPK